ncbi:MAG: hypothetical protein SH807_00910 [Blastochloris sp.]|jgi:uncharacterized membrane protein YkvA (DUF1232 family)|nr:hypothetical protein [Blastochloris sp.]
MSEIANFVRHGAGRINQHTLQSLLHELPFLKLEFTQIEAPRFPHLVDQLTFLVDVVEDYAEGQAPELPYVTIAESIFALLYAHKRVDLIPDVLGDMGRADDSSVVRAVLIMHEPDFRVYAERQKMDWKKITSKA